MSKSGGRTWVTSDLHFSHAGVTKFLMEDGVTKLRPWDNIEDMDEELIRNFNDHVKPGDKCYFLGDMVINRRGLPQIGRLNGDKILIKGNHDIFRLDEYLKYFRDIRAYQIQNNIVMSHIPIHSESKDRFKANIHGHTHANKVKDQYGNVDPWYICVCVEQTEFKPVLVSDLYDRINNNF